MKKITTLLLLALTLGATQAPSATVSLLRVRGYNHSVTKPSTDGFSEANVQAIKAEGGNLVRIHLFYDASYGSFASVWPTIRSKTIQKVQWCKNQGVKAVICFGFSPWDDVGVPFNSQAMWNRSDLSSKYCQLWKDIANDLAPNKDAVWAYDLINEPHYTSWTVTPPQWRQLAIDIINAIHTVDPNAWCVYETGPGSRSDDFATLQPLPCTRVIYGAHFYLPQPFTHEDTGVSSPGSGTYRYPGTSDQYVGDLGVATANKANFQAKLQPARTFQTTYNVPIYFGEFSASAGAQLPDSANWLADVVSIFEQWGWSWSYHAYQDAPCWDLNLFDTQRKPKVLAGLANNNPADFDSVNDSAFVTSPVANGTYKVIARHSGKGLDAAGTADGNNVQQWQYGGGNNQRWTLTQLGGGQYKIIGVQSGKSLDVGGTGDGANVQLWTYGGGNNQRWTLTATSGGYYAVKAVHSGKALDVNGASTLNGANVQQWTYGGGNNQQWAFQAP